MKVEQAQPYLQILSEGLKISCVIPPHPKNEVKEADGEWCMRWFDFGPVEQAKFWLDGLYDGGCEDLDNGDWKVYAALLREL